MDSHALIKTLAICIISIIIEAVAATTSGKKWFASLKQPRYSPSLKTWYIVGGAYYIIFAIIGYRQFLLGASFHSPSLLLLVLIMLINGSSNFLLFKFHSLKWFYFILYPFAIFLIALIIILFRNDILSSIFAFGYFVWLMYDLYYCYYLWKLNS